MTHTLFVYEHCPYCVKARMIFGIKKLPLKIEYILNDDVETPTKMIGQKLVPILQKPDGSHMGESMDIVAYADNLNGAPIIAKPPTHDMLEYWFVEAKNYINPLAMPRWAIASPALPEFETQGAIDYFTQKKEGYLGESFQVLLAKSDEMIMEMNFRLQSLADIIHSSTQVLESGLSEYDIHLFAALHSLSIVDGLNYPDKAEAYRQHFAQTSGVPLLAPLVL